MAQRQRNQRQLRPRCHDWNQWKTDPAGHAPFHYWRWDELEPTRSTARLGQRMYTTACLLWASMHDAGGGKRLAQEHPNWSAISHYYSMVHSLRLAWFVLYGGYPTGHANLVKPFTGTESAVANWAHGDLRAGTANIYRDALHGAIRAGLGNAALADELPTVGKIFEVSRKLREDANYESLLLAHQYYHRAARPTMSGDVDVKREFTDARGALEEAAIRVHTFTGKLLLTVFDDEKQWFCPRARYSASSLRRFVSDDVDTLIETASRESAPLAPFDWWEGPFRDVKCRPGQSTQSAEVTLGEHRQLDAFHVKRTVMQKFGDKVASLRRELGGGNECQ